jgi:hypothetical protein
MSAGFAAKLFSGLNFKLCDTLSPLRSLQYLILLLPIYPSHHFYVIDNEVKSIRCLFGVGNGSHCITNLCPRWMRSQWMMPPFLSFSQALLLLHTRSEVTTVISSCYLSWDPSLRWNMELFLSLRPDTFWHCDSPRWPCKRFVNIDSIHVGYHANDAQEGC